MANEDAPIVSYMSPADFQRLGYLQEVNRLFLHPLGLALSVDVDEDGTVCLGKIWDHRHDPEGLWFGGDFPVFAREKADRIMAEMVEHLVERNDRLGFSIEPIPDKT